jgi:selT/selW/selH-like putative selenoprotein
LAEELRDKLNADIKIIPGWIGVFKVFVDDQLVFSKAKEGRFPDSNEIINIIKSKKPINIPGKQ